MTTTTLKITGMTCGHCVSAVKGALESMPGVKSVAVDLAAGRATIEHDGQTTPDGLASNVMDEGYMAEEVK